MLIDNAISILIGIEEEEEKTEIKMDFKSFDVHQTNSTARTTQHNIRVFLDRMRALHSIAHA